MIVQVLQVLLVVGMTLGVVWLAGRVAALVRGGAIRRHLVASALRIVLLSALVVTVALRHAAPALILAVAVTSFAAIVLLGFRGLHRSAGRSGAVLEEGR